MGKVIARLNAAAQGYGKSETEIQDACQGKG
jgi:hypothetical protein